MKEKLSSQNKKIISNVLDEIMDEYAADNKIIFRNESDRAMRHFGSVSKRLKDWKKSKKCMVPECKNRSIIRSHTIPKRMSLSSISEDNHLLTPEFDQRTGILKLKKIGVSIASTFPGFCSQHERLFEDFETQKKLDSETHIYLQTYRSACRELFRSKLIIEQNEWVRSSYCKLRDQRLLEHVRRKAIERGFPKSVAFSSFSFSNDPLIEEMMDRISGVRQLSACVEHRILPALEQIIFNGCESDAYIEAFNIDLQLPVALSGCAAFIVANSGIQEHVYIIMNVLPCDDHSILIIAGDINFKDQIKHYISRWMSNVFSMISMVESWMVNGTDQWYLRPSVWGYLTAQRKKKILNAILECNQNIGHEYGLSIFDELRTTLLKMLKDREEPTKDVAYWRFVNTQEAKMT